MSSALAGALWMSAAASHAQARPPEGTGLMRRQMVDYFQGELEGAAMFGGLGAGAGYAGGVLLAHATDASRAAAVPVLAVGAIQLGAALVLLVRTPGQVRELDAQLRERPAAYREEELERMTTVDFWFGVYRTIELCLLVGGAGAAAAGAVLDEDRALGAGLGLATQSATMLALDAFAEKRAERYIDALRSFEVAPRISADDYSLTLGGRF